MMERKETCMPSVVTTVPLLQYKPGDLGLVPAARSSMSPTVLQKLGKVSILPFQLCIMDNQFIRYLQGLLLNYLQ